MNRSDSEDPGLGLAGYRPALARLSTKFYAARPVVLPKPYGTLVDWEAYAGELENAMAEAEASIEFLESWVQSARAEIARLDAVVPETKMSRKDAARHAARAKGLTARARSRAALRLQVEGKTRRQIGQILAADDGPLPKSTVKTLLGRARKEAPSDRPSTSGETVKARLARLERGPEPIGE